jgi:hypothetical protein
MKTNYNLNKLFMGIFVFMEVNSKLTVRTGSFYVARGMGVYSSNIRYLGGASSVNNVNVSHLFPLWGNRSSFSSLPIIFKRSYSSSNLPLKPWFVTGFVDAEGCFLVSIVKNDNLRTGWEVICRFKIGLHTKDYLLLEQIKTYFGVGTLTINVKNNSCVFEVTSLEGIINNLLPHFHKHPLISNKLADYLLFKEVVLIMQQKGHLTVPGLQTIVNLRAALNNGLSDTLKEAFPLTVSSVRPIVPESIIPDQN